MPAKQITPEAIERIRTNTPRRVRFSASAKICKREDGVCVIGLRLASLGRLLRHDTGIVTNSGPYGPYRYLHDAKEITAALRWQEKHKSYIFLRDMLDMSLAIDYNFADRLVYTELGKAEDNAKNARHQPSIRALAKACVRAISDVSYYRESDVICAVPPSLDKEWDLPTEIVRLVCEETGKPNVSNAVRFAAPKKNIKAAALAEK